MTSPRTAHSSTPLLAALLLGSVSASPLAPEARAGAQRDQNRVVSEIRQIQVQLATLVETQTVLTEAVESLLAEREEQITADRRSRAETLNALERMERNVATLSEAFQESNDRLSALMVEVESVREAQRRAALAGGAAGLAVGLAVGATPGDQAADGEATGTGATPEAGIATEAPSEDAPVAEGATVLDEPSVSEVYLKAHADYLQGRYSLALPGFEQVATGGGELADDARYLMGECLLALERLDDALGEFDTVIRDFPDSSKTGEAWYKKGLIFGRMGHESDAREIFEDILDVFAGTPAARLAKRELDAMPPRDPGG